MQLHAARSIRMALFPFRARITSMEVVLRIVGRMTSCRVYVGMTPDLVIVDHAEELWAHLAVERAADRVRDAVARELGLPARTPPEVC
jgi:hypothetical protein